MKKAAMKIIAALGILSLPTPALAYHTVRVGDASQIKFVISGNRVYLRNLDSFDSNWLGCCYNYWMDLTTETGKSQYAYFLLRYASGESIDLLVNDRTQPGAIYHLGNFM
ncbi:hypothetical protein SAMN02745824_3372 [Parasphingorhabdus marina DSM 22363]|uniref:Beta/Gamma crystallin n=1 Tax=Parasphingorhabdus marina DSM 22363 TaxID=1123272 RepID=A0A1N6HNG9_9SPHN|nr:hypothetical protein [Parasphingorhabdus marina]SIO21229.1 hypothetical protein SAMN02745824_3372 [Parasphingorhabdus marina DSM 22363]